MLKIKTDGKLEREIYIKANQKLKSLKITDVVNKVCFKYRRMRFLFWIL